MRAVLRSLKPTEGISHVLHQLLVLVLPAFVFVLIQLNFVQLAFSVIVLSKWRMFAVRPRFWAATVRANAIDLMVGLSIAVFMTQSTSYIVQLLWAGAYAVWLLYIKPGASLGMVSLQAVIGQYVALTALYMAWSNGPVAALTILTGLFCFFAARHFLDSFDEPYARFLAYVWAYFGAAIAWVLSHWLLYYHGLAQPTLLLSALGYGMAGVYYLDHTDRLSTGVRRQLIFVMLAIVLVVLAFSDWGDKVV